MAALKSGQQEKFVQECVSGKTQYEAYLIAYPGSEKSARTTIEPMASRLMAKPEVTNRYRELQHEAAHAAGGAVMSRNEKRAMLALMARDENASLADRQRAIDLDNKMEDEYTNNVSLKGNVSNPFAGMSTEELRKMVGNG